MGLLVFVFLALQVAAALPERVVQGLPGRVASLDLFTLTGLETYAVTGNVVEPLARLHPKTHELIPCLATGWHVNRETGVFRVMLRPGVRFHNGDLLSANDVKFTFDAYFDPRFKGELWRPMWQGVSSVSVVDPLTVEFKVSEVRYQSLENLLTTLRVLPKSVYAHSTPESRRSHLIGTGPFKLGGFAANQSVRLVPNESWWAGTPPEFSLVSKYVADAQLARQMMDKGELDYFEVPTSESASLLKERRLKKFPAVRGEGVWIHLNLRKPVLNDERVREALVRLWNREQANQKIFLGEFKLAADIFSPQMSFYPAGRALEFDIERARALLQSAGWRDQDRDGVLEKEIAGRVQSLHIRILMHSAEDGRWLSLFQNDAAKAGVQVTLHLVEDEARWWKLLQEGKYEAGSGTGGLEIAVLPGSWQSQGAYNSAGYRDALVDKKLKRLEGEFDSSARASLQRDLILRLRQQVVALPGLYSPNSHFLVSDRLVLDPESPQLAWRWRLKERQIP